MFHIQMLYIHVHKMVVDHANIQLIYMNILILHKQSELVFLLGFYYIDRCKTILFSYNVIAVKLIKDI